MCFDVIEVDTSAWSVRKVYMTCVVGVTFLNKYPTLPGITSNARISIFVLQLHAIRTSSI